MSKTIKTRPASLRRLPTGWQDIALICRKCGKKLKGGFGPNGEDSLRRALRDTLRVRRRRGEIGLLEVDCFGVCPKAGVTMAWASAPDALLIVGAGADAAAVLDGGGRVANIPRPAWDERDAGGEPRQAADAVAE